MDLSVPSQHYQRVLSLVLPVSAGVLLLLCGCEPETPEPTATRTAREPRQPASQWKSIDDSSQVAVPIDEQSEAMRQAIVRARETADAARRRWREAADEERSYWAIKWAAATGDGGVEYVWVMPLHWSPFRVEGRLANPPQRALAGDAQPGDIVSFPAEQLVDWVHFTEQRIGGPREGGFTIDVLEERFGQADPNGHREGAPSSGRGR